MHRLPRILIALTVLVSGLALTPYVDLPKERLSWQLYADVYEPSTAQVSIQSFAFTPDTILISVGTTVRWTNNDSLDHTVTSINGTVTSNSESFDSGPLAPGESFEHRFDVPGTYRYICTIHPSMQGTVIVAEQVSEVFMPIITK